MARIISDIDNSQIKRILDVLATETDMFVGYSNQEIEELVGVLRVVNFKK